MNIQYLIRSFYTIVLLLIIICTVGCADTPKANSTVFNYSDFGPQVMSYEMIGYEWYQWDSQGPDGPNQSDDVKVVVYRNVPLEQIKEKYPVIEEKQDYRYLEYSLALEHLNKYEEDSFWDEYPEAKEIVRKTKERILKELGK